MNLDDLWITTMWLRQEIEHRYHANECIFDEHRNDRNPQRPKNRMYERSNSRKHHQAREKDTWNHNNIETIQLLVTTSRLNKRVDNVRKTFSLLFIIFIKTGLNFLNREAKANQTAWTHLMNTTNRIEYFASCQLIGHLVFLNGKSNVTKIKIF